MISADNFWPQFGHRTALAMVHGLTGWQQCWKLVFALTEMLGNNSGNITSRRNDVEAVASAIRVATR